MFRLFFSVSCASCFYSSGFRREKWGLRCEDLCLLFMFYILYFVFIFILVYSIFGVYERTADAQFSVLVKKTPCAGGPSPA